VALIGGGYQRERTFDKGKQQGKQVRQGSQPASGRAAPVLAPDTEPSVAKQGWQNAINSTVSGLGYELVEVERAQRGLLRITIDRIPGRVYESRRESYEAGVEAADKPVDSSEFITVEDCEKVTRQLQYALEVEGLDYARLEVSSPGLDRPLKREADYARFAGQAVQVQLKMPFQGRKSWQGVLTPADPAAENSGWSLVFKEGKTEQVLNFTLAEVREARLLPVVDFKGRKLQAAQSAAANSGNSGAAAAAPQDVGG
jgi:ribosome maturation factor RimP